MIWGTLLLLLGVGPLQAADNSSTDDMMLCLQAQKLLHDDVLLRRFNLGVRVRHREIELWGTIPSLELSLRAEIKLRTLLDALKVRNDLFVHEGPIVPAGPPQPRDIPEYLPDIQPVLPSFDGSAPVP